MKENEPLSAEQSLNLITSMIHQAKGNMQKSSFYFLLWGWTILLCNLGIYLMLMFTAIENPFWVWLVTIPAAIASGIHGRKQEQNTHHTHLDDINKWLWMGFGITCFIIVLFGSKIRFQINPIIVSMSAVPTLVSGVMLKFRPLIIGGIIFWVCGLVLFLLPTREQFLLSSIAIALGYVVPGYQLKAQRE